MSVESIYQHTDHVNANLWEFYFEDFLDMRYYIISASLPFLKFESQTRNTGTKHITSISPESNFSVTFHETNDYLISNYLLDWRESIYDSKNRVFKRGSYVKNALFAMQRLINGNLEYTKAFKFEDVMLIDYNDWELSYDNSENLRITAEFTVDTVYEVSSNQVIVA
jgi:hypothetical protein